jgi:uncharacterized protein (DUF1810 family)
VTDAASSRIRGAAKDVSDDDPYGLERFVTAQDAAGTYLRALQELSDGRKATHWMWFVFPQIAGLGQSPTSRAFAISSLAEAEAYRRHPVLGPRLVECARILVDGRIGSATHIFGAIDAQKLHSSMTLFMPTAPEEPLFRQVVDRFFGGRADVGTERRL